MDERCPVCGGKLTVSGYKSPEELVCQNPQCPISFWSRKAIGLAHATRARLIAEAVKPWREALEDSQRVCLRRIEDGDDCFRCHNEGGGFDHVCPNLIKAKALLNPEFVKTTN